MRVYKTGHQIADTVADALVKGCCGWLECDIAYGILRGAADMFKQSNSWFNVDRGYWGANHFDGYYRISYKGTQAKWRDDIPKAEVGVKFEDWKDNKDGYILICPPTEPVMIFYNCEEKWWDWYYYWMGEHWEQGKWKVRRKGDESEIDWPNIKGVITFNSSVGWQALQRGIPCISDTTHSLVGSYYKHELDKLGLEYNLDNVKLIPRGPLFQSMGAHQFTLMEIRQGKAWKLIEHYLAIS